MIDALTVVDSYLKGLEDYLEWAKTLSNECDIVKVTAMTRVETAITIRTLLEQYAVEQKQEATA